MSRKCQYVLRKDEGEGIAFTEVLTVSTDATAIRIPAVAGLYFFDESLCRNVQTMSTVTLYLPFHILVVFGIGVERFVTPILIFDYQN